MPDMIRHPVSFWIPAFAGMTSVTYLIAGVISKGKDAIEKTFEVPVISTQFDFTTMLKYRVDK